MRKIHAGVALCALTATLVGIGNAASKDRERAEEAILIKGVVADASGPLVRKTIFLMPIGDLGPTMIHRNASAGLGEESVKDPKTGVWTRTYTISDDPTIGQRLNPAVITDDSGAFEVTLPMKLLTVTRHKTERYKVDEIALGVFDGLVSSWQPEIVKLGKNSTAIDLGQVVLKPVPSPAK